MGGSGFDEKCAYDALVAVIGQFFERPAGLGDRIPVIPPLQRMEFRSTVQLNRDQLRIFEVEGRSLFVPLVGFITATIGAVFAVEKPGHMDGVNTLSFQFFHHEGFAAFKVFLTFGGAAPPAERVTQFNGLRLGFVWK